MTYSGSTGCEGTTPVYYYPSLSSEQEVRESALKIAAGLKQTQTIDELIDNAVKITNFILKGK